MPPFFYVVYGQKKAHSGCGQGMKVKKKRVLLIARVFCQMSVLTLI